MRTERAVCDRVKGEVRHESRAAVTRETGCGHELMVTSHELMVWLLMLLLRWRRWWW